MLYTVIYQKVENTTMDIIHHDPINQFEGSLTFTFLQTRKFETPLLLYLDKLHF